MMNAEYYQYSTILFRENNLEVSYLDEIRIEFFFDNIELHRIYLETNKDNKDSVMSEYIDKIYSILAEWQSKLDNSVTKIEEKSVYESCF